MQALGLQRCRFASAMSVSQRAAQWPGLRLQRGCSAANRAEDIAAYGTKVDVCAPRVSPTAGGKYGVEPIVRGSCRGLGELEKELLDEEQNLGRETGRGEVNAAQRVPRRHAGGADDDDEMRLCPPFKSVLRRHHGLRRREQLT